MKKERRKKNIEHRLGLITLRLTLYASVIRDSSSLRLERGSIDCFTIEIDTHVND